MTSSVRAKRAADQKAANRKEEDMRLAKLEMRGGGAALRGKRFSGVY